eukprot:PhF_6_TR20397/c0_g1_i1/m.29371
MYSATNRHRYGGRARRAVGLGLLQGIALHLVWVGLLCIAMSVSVAVVLGGKFCNNAAYSYPTVQNVHMCPGSPGDMLDGYCMLCCSSDPSVNAMNCLQPGEFEFPTVYPKMTFVAVLLGTGFGSLGV